MQLQNPLTYLINYRLTATSLQITAMGGMFVVREFPYSSIVEVKRGYEFWNEHYENRVDLWSSAVSVRLNRPILPWVVITPENPDTFVSDLRKRLA
jgi:hypothetical protein